MAALFSFSRVELMSGAAPDPGRGPIVAIDGPAGVGKSTVGRRLARVLGVPFISTGLMYRAVAHAALSEGIDPNDEVALGRVAGAMRFDLAPQGGLRQLTIDGGVPGPGLESTEVEAVVSQVAAHGTVRTILRWAQRGLGEQGCVMEGRDIASVVFPDADVKIHLEGHPDVRARRRKTEREGGSALAEAIAERDALDAKTTPPAPLPEAARIDTTELDEDEVYEAALRVVRARIPELFPSSRSPGRSGNGPPGDTVR
jgi:cytidylate kinase